MLECSGPEPTHDPTCLFTSLGPVQAPLGPAAWRCPWPPPLPPRQRQRSPFWSWPIFCEAVDSHWKAVIRPGASGPDCWLSGRGKAVHWLRLLSVTGTSALTTQTKHSSRSSALSRHSTLQSKTASVYRCGSAAPITCKRWPQNLPCSVCVCKNTADPGKWRCSVGVTF